MTHPAYTLVESRARETFLALMSAFSYPGRIYQLPDVDESYILIAETLLDLETSYYSSDETLHPMLERTGGRSLPPEAAAYHFYPSVNEVELAAMQTANFGTMLYPDEAATFVVGCKFNEGEKYVLHGPGIRGQQPIQISGLPNSFWELRESVCRYPLGWDVYLVDEQQLIGLPRSARVERV